LTKLSNIAIDNNQISDISPLAGLTNLTFLYLNDNQISDISPLAGLTNLDHLYLWDNQISDISPLTGLTNLTTLALSGNQISDISSLVGLTNLDWLGLDDNPLYQEACNVYIPQMEGHGTTVDHDPCIHVKVPNVVGKTQAAAQSAITSAGLVVGTVTRAHSDTVPQGCVISQGLPAGTPAVGGSSVDLVVSSGPPVEVPNVVGMTESAAELTLTGVHLVIGGKSWTLSGKPRGTVLDQDPAPGTTMSAGSVVDLTLSQGPRRFYVDTRARGKNNGLTWTDAFVHLQNALVAAFDGDEIWVAQGTYKPDEGGAIIPDPDSREATFTLVKGVATYGGFPPRGGDWEQRDPNLYETILSGDIGVAGDPNDNSYHVVVASGTDANTVLDGFTITAGNADGEGDYIYAGGMFNVRGHLSVANCLFTGNAADRGGAVFNRFSDAKFLNCRFIGNTCRIDGGAMVNRASNTILRNCVFGDNVAARSGGGMLAFEGGKPSVINCRFEGNSAGSSGGGVVNGGSESVFFGCVFIGNTSVGGGGALYNADCLEPIYSVNCTFSGNSSTSNKGGALYNKDSLHTLVNCIFWGNHAKGGSQIAAYVTSDVEIHHCCVEGGQADIFIDPDTLVNWGLGNVTTDPLFVDADGADGIPGTEDDRLDLMANSPCLDAGDNKQVPTDVADLDGDGNTTERLPLDIASKPRFVDNTAAANKGVADPPTYPAIVDMGAYERGK